jgi:hypothetical protein
MSNNDDELEGLVLEKSFFCFKIFSIIDTLFLKNIKQRTSDEWNYKGLQDIKT